VKITKSTKNAIKSYLKAVAVSAITLGLALVADIRPEYAVLAAALVAPIVKYLDPQDEQVG
jgi:uncharacterized membrane protein YfbV (UPF0208 family)